MKNTELIPDSWRIADVSEHLRYMAKREREMCLHDDVGTLDGEQVCMDCGQVIEEE